MYWVPYIYNQPTNRIVEIGGITTFFVNAGGGPTPSYQWLFNGKNLSGATNISFTLTNVQLANAGNYSVVISNMLGSVVSSNALLTVQSASTPPSISSQPASVSVGAGGNAAFTVGASGSSPLSYQWSLNTTNLPNATNATLVVFNVQPANAGNYVVTITNPYGTTNSATAVLTVQTFPPFITSQPTGLSVQVGDGATFTVSATGTAPLSYQWMFNGTNLVNATNASLVLSKVQTNNAGNYAVTITNPYGTTNSASAGLAVTLPPSGGYIFFNNLNFSSTKIFTNSSIGGPVTGLTDTNLGKYFYALFASATASTVSGGNSNITGAASSAYAFNDAAWTLVAYGTNTLVRGRLASTSADANSQTPVPGFAAGSTPRFVVVGWSVGIGTNIAAVKNWFNFGYPITDGWIGQSAVSGTLTLGDGVIIPSSSLFGTTAPRLLGFSLGLASPNTAANYPPPNNPAPVINTVVAGNSIKLIWPVNYSNYKVQSSGGMGAIWNDVSGTPLQEGTNLTMTLPLAGSGPYFRLIVQ